ncbi:MAG: hypothetical protein NTZ65_00420 [Candidatus Berkelbacteria bacterium]|nr:hypothetical protein [Candidatus Berkelbacteria bacterium]
MYLWVATDISGEIILPPWQDLPDIKNGFGEFSKILAHLDATLGRKPAEEFLLGVIVNFLDYTEMLKLGLGLVTGLYHEGCTLSGQEDDLSRAISNLEVFTGDMSETTDELTFLVNPDDFGEQNYALRGRIQRDLIRKVFATPWVIMEHLGLEGSVCKHFSWGCFKKLGDLMGEMGIGPVGWREFRISVTVNDGQEDQIQPLVLSFWPNGLHAWIPDAGKGFWVYADGLDEPVWISSSITDIFKIQNCLIVSPNNSRNEIEAAFGRLDLRRKKE